MSVLIKNMRMPETCESCNLESFCGLWIDARRMVGWTPENHGNPIRHPECPLVEIPPHGRLIEAGNLAARAFRYLLMSGDESPKIVFASAIKDAPTIIEEDFTEDTNVRSKAGESV